ncbi:RICIN domain-containing protein [Paenibacillus alba]|uniref:RICIN domain-containing protein n=1 Tax=Paenibacillus alba TaxID=1197127 RepID=A0ABU6FYS8_9BACL|nr:RICIN domain-containing protein [Paenibacillus alba]MEC0226559.1 RICIN domain-containing protein [Paenibacillus alba]
MYVSKMKWQVGNLLTKMILAAALMFGFTFTMAQPASAATVVTYPSYFGTSSAYSLKVDSTTIRVARQFDYSFAQLSYSGTGTFKVTASENITSYNISPHSYGIEATVSGKDLTFTLPQAGSRYLVIKINNLENLVIMADPVETGAPTPNGGSVKSIMDYSGVDNTGGNLMTSKIQQAINDANARSGGGTVYFPAGIYKFSQIELKSNVTLYLAAGSILRGSSDVGDYDFTNTIFTNANIRIVGASNVAIKGRGMIDSNGTTLTTGASGPNREYIIHSYKDASGTKPNNLTFEGFTLRDGTTWNFRIQDATNVKINNVKIINNVNWIHGDGFDLVNTSHAVVDQCFAYTGDDVYDAKASTEEPMTDVVYKNSVAYTESAGTKVGMQGNASISDVWFINIDVIQGYRGVSVDHDQGNGVWDDIHFIDIRTEKIFNNGTSGQFRTSPLLVWTAKYSGTEVGPVSNVELTRVSFENINNFHSFIQGYDSSSKVSNISITDLKMNGNVITNASQGLIDIGANTSNITFNTNPATRKIMNADSSKAVEVFGGSTTDGAKISQWDYSGGKNQRWQLVDAGGGYYKIKNLKSGKLLEVTGGSTANGALVEQWGDNGGDNQQWQIVDVGNGYSKLINRKSGKALDSGGTTADGAQLTQWTDNGGDNQKWQLME